MKIERSRQEVDKLLNFAADCTDNGRSPYPGMTYEQGVEAGIRWLIGESDDPPFDDDAMDVDEDADESEDGYL